MSDGDAPVQVRLGTLLTIHFPDADRRVWLQVRSVVEMVDALDARWPGLRGAICDTTPAIRPHMNVFVDGRRVGLDAPLAPGANVYILSAVSGG